MINPTRPTHSFPATATQTDCTHTKGSITIYERLSAQRTEAVEAAILREALRRGKSKEHLKVDRTHTKEMNHG